MIGTLHAAADLLRAAADGYRTGLITWGRDGFITGDGCRCMVAAITWAADPEDVDNGGNPFWLRNPSARLHAQTAVAVVAEHLTTRLGHPWRLDGGECDITETVGSWNDERTSLDEVVAELETVAEILRPAELDVAS